MGWKVFPDGGAPAGKSVSELMTNIIEKKGKDGQYAYGVFKLYTATKAYRDLARLASADDTENGSKYVPDALSAEYCVGAIEALLPSILQTGEPYKATDKTARACTEIAQMLLTYSDIGGSEEAKNYARSVSEKIKSSSGTARPV